MRKIYTLLIFLAATGLARGQEINFSRVQDMTIWYNQSLKTDKQNSLDLNYRSVTFGGQIAYNSVAALFSMPLVSKAAKDKPNSGYLSFSAGAASDNPRNRTFPARTRSAIAPTLSSIGVFGSTRFRS